MEDSKFISVERILDDDQGYQLGTNITLYIVSGLSIAFTLFMVIAILVTEERKDFKNQLLINIFLSDCLFAFAVFMHFFNNDDNSVVCTFQGMFISYFSLTSFCWSFCTCFRLYLKVCTDQDSCISIKRAIDLDKAKLYFYLLAYGLPLYSTLFPLIANRYNFTDDG